MIRNKPGNQPPCKCHPTASASLAGYLDSTGTYQEGTNPDPTYGGTVLAPDQAPANNDYTTAQKAADAATIAKWMPAAPLNWQLIGISAAAAFGVLLLAGGRRR